MSPLQRNELILLSTYIDPGDRPRQPMTATNVAECMRSVNLSANARFCTQAKPFCPASRQLTPEHVRLEHHLMESCASAMAG